MFLLFSEEVTISEAEKQLTAMPDKNNLLNTMLPDQLGKLHNHIGENDKGNWKCNYWI